MGLSPIVAGALAAAVTAALTPLVIRLARRTGVMDHPGPLKPHASPVPYLGGLAVFGGAATGMIPSPHPTALLPLAAALLLGVLDDVASLPVLPRFLAELAVGAGVAWSVGLDVSLVAVLVVVGTVVLINAVNFVDGIDALAAGVCAVSFAGFAVVLSSGWVQSGAALAGATAGFLLFNRPPARIYLGDAGSYLLGTALAVLAAAHIVDAQLGSALDQSTGFAGAGIRPVDALLLVPLLGYPLVEVVSTVGRRVLARLPIFAGDRDHVYDRIVQQGLSAPPTAALLIGVQTVLVSAGLAAHWLETMSPAVAISALVVGGTIIAAVPGEVRPRPPSSSAR